MIINELLSNALKHAFSGRGEGKIEVSLATSEGGRINLAVSDDGVGLPPGFDINESKTLGLRLVKILAEDPSCKEPWRSRAMAEQPLRWSLTWTVVGLPVDRAEADLRPEVLFVFKEGVVRFPYVRLNERYFY
ncbi:MAG: hypothetical protein GQ567_02935 [Methanosarcinales archaeon]|nr:hypothetical protein [Methanosarcinales archaeon]